MHKLEHKVTRYDAAAITNMTALRHMRRILLL